MNKVKFLYIIIVLLVATNASVLLGVYLHRPHHPHNEGGPKKFIIEKLGLDEAQTKTYDIIIKQHRSSIKSIENNIRKNKDVLFTLLKEDDVTKKDSIITNLGALQMEIESAHYIHFEAIKKICNDEQLERFDDLTKELGRLFSPPKPPKKPKQ
jgi:protein CpxP